MMAKTTPAAAADLFIPGSSSDLSSDACAGLHQLADAAGLMVDWEDAQGEARRVSPEVLRQVLGAMGLPCTDEAQCAASLALLAAENAELTPPPLVTAVQNQPVCIDWLDAGDTAPAYALHGEDGSLHTGHATRHQDGSWQIPGVAHTGYHTLEVSGHRLTLAVAPPRCYSIEDALQASPARPASQDSSAAINAARLWALSVQLYALRDSLPRKGGGIGDFSTLASCCTAAAAQGAAGVAVNPLHAGFSADPARYSPYAPSSRLFLNPLYIDPAACFGQAADEAARALGLLDEQQRLEQLTEIDWPGVARVKLAILRYLFERRADLLDQRKLGDFQRFCKAGGDALHTHAVFEALHHHHTQQGAGASHWRDWPAQQQEPHSNAVREFADRHAAEVEFHLFLQWLAALGLDQAQHTAREAGMALGLIADLAVGTDTSGSHAWSRQDEIFDGLSAGAPPDVYNPLGQSWGISAFSPRGLRRHGFRALIEMLRAVLAQAGGLRIDHALGLARLWVVPHQAGPGAGAYLHYPFDDMMRLIALESWRARAVIIGENLGTVPQGFNQRLTQHGMLGIGVLWFERGPDAAFRLPAQWSPAMSATTTTHDLPSVAGWWSGNDIAWRARLDLLGPEQDVATEHTLRQTDRLALWQAFSQAGLVTGSCPPASSLQAVDAALAFVGLTPAPLVTIPIEDLLALREQPNIPGTVSGHPNWCRRLDGALPALLDESETVRRVTLLNTARRQAQ